MTSAVFVLVGVVIGAAASFSFALLGGRLDRNRARRNAAAGLRYEMELNLEWSKSLTPDGLGPYLRDEVHNSIKNQGGISGLPDDVRRRLISTYEALYRVNEATRRLRESDDRSDAQEYVRLVNDFQSKGKDLPGMLEPLQPTSMKYRERRRRE